MAAVALAWESQSTRRVGCSAVARQAARFTAVVVFPTPPFWFATAIIRVNDSPNSRKVSRIEMVMQLVSRGTVSRESEFSTERRAHLLLPTGQFGGCFTWNTERTELIRGRLRDL